MTSYTLRHPTTMQPVTSTDSLTAALDQLEVERLAFLLNPPPAADDLELVITADTTTAQIGDVVIWFAAGHTPDRVEG